MSTTGDPSNHAVYATLCPGVGLWRVLHGIGDHRRAVGIVMY